VLDSVNKIASHYPVVIIGAGPTGLTLANLLGRYQVRFLLVERNSTTVQEPRAVSIDDEALRTMQAAGVINAVLPGIVPGYGSIYYTARRTQFAKVEPLDAPYGYPRRNAFRQPVLEAQLRDALAAAPTASTLFGAQLEDFTRREQEVELRITSADGDRREVRCDYLVGCDGAASTVRSTLGINLEGTTYAKRWLIIDLENNDNSIKHSEVFCDHRRPCITLPGPQRTRRFEFEMTPDETDTELLAPERVSALLVVHGADPDASIRRKAVYRFHARVAPQWRLGRVLIAGDAAHLTPPFAGQGMNSGIRDAHNLAWKLAAVIQSRIGPELLHSYGQERRDHAWEMIRLALRMGRVMSPPDGLSALTTQLAFRTLNLWPPARNYIAQMKYKPKPRFAAGFMVADGRSARRTLVGRLLPQPEVITQDQGRLLLDEILGPHFALLVRTQDPEGVFALLQQQIWDELGAARVAILPPGTNPRAWSRGVVVEECDNSLAASLGRDRSKVILVRPDRYVGACFALSDADAAAVRVRDLVAATWCTQ
jgi:3-(3-hydroxy-phenyl)propionate hydroxylase